MQCFSLFIITTLFATVTAEGTQLKTPHIRGGAYQPKLVPQDKKLSETSTTTNISVEQAESACSSRLDDPQDIKGCAFYVMAAQDLDMVAEYLILRAYEQPDEQIMTPHRKLLEEEASSTSGNNISMEQAEAACSERLDLPHLIKACSAYVMKAQSLEAVGDYLLLQAYQPEELDGDNEDEPESEVER